MSFRQSEGSSLRYPSSSGFREFDLIQFKSTASWRSSLLLFIKPPINDCQRWNFIQTSLFLKWITSVIYLALRRQVDAVRVNAKPKRVNIVTVSDAPLCVDVHHEGWNGYSATNVTVFCTLDSNPTDIDFDWFVQTGLKKSDKIRWNFSIVNETTSRAVIDLSRFEQPSVTVECEGKNDIGLQRLPCVLQLSKSKYRRNKRQLLASRERKKERSGANGCRRDQSCPAGRPATHQSSHQPEDARARARARRLVPSRTHALSQSVASAQQPLSIEEKRTRDCGVGKRDPKQEKIPRRRAEAAAKRAGLEGTTSGLLNSFSLSLSRARPNNNSDDRGGEYDVPQLSPKG